ncbi:hypothetical protein F5I97DRAFT_1964022 [Phlebopus sp. FC_14]|nr:hypothetical protein F5I97DRAFT_1964022 [Phlebopus sp. FC_14]
MAYRAQPREPRPVQSNPPVDPAFLLKNLGKPVAAFKSAGDVMGVYPLKNVKVIASYSWIEGATPIVAVPGSPRVWKNIHVTRVPADTGVQMIDENALRMGDKSPLLPLFVAIDSLHKDFQYGDLDLVTDRNSLRKLLRFADGAAGEFRIDVDLANKTCLLTRREEKNSERIVGFRGFSQEYEKAATRAASGCEKASSHHRIISYDFGGIKVLLRFVDEACTERGDEADDLLASFSSMNIGRVSQPVAPLSRAPIASASGLTVRLTKPTSLVPQSNTIEIKTRASHKIMDWNEVYPQLYLSQTAHLYLAKHERGSFQRVEKYQLNGSNLRDYAVRTEKSMGKLKVLLDAILRAVRKLRTRDGIAVPLSLVCQGDTLTLYRRDASTGYPLGKEILSKFGGVELPSGSKSPTILRK